MASVRTTNVGSSSYLQVVEYVKEQGKRKTKVLRSFGPDNLENRLRAQQFVSNYNTLKEIAKKEVKKQNVDVNDLLKGALVIFGIILGAALISEIIDSLAN